MRSVVPPAGGVENRSQFAVFLLLFNDLGVDRLIPRPKIVVMTNVCDNGQLAAISEFEQRSKHAETLDELSALVDAIVRESGFRWFALVHNVDLARRSNKALLLTTYPEAWIEEVIEDRLYLDDPVHAACARSPSGLTWDRIEDFITMSPRQTTILERGRAHGLDAGFTMPIRVSDEPEAMFTVSRSGDHEVTSDEVLVARLIGTVAFDRGRSILGDDRQVYAPVALIAFAISNNVYVSTKNRSLRSRRVITGATLSFSLIASRKPRDPPDWGDCPRAA
ncbi:MULTISPECIES: autoinducer binding domain-containing protein [unclassified Sphingomonas]|uniref:autoinducer binding domain-containing protein n=2 Tax=unclassified Sphingomonas TaxID=196159 RepID=UPI00082CB0C4|nr:MULTISPECIES: autoinducer binding domain-containing protein [unclassified Sphingomonas]